MPRRAALLIVAMLGISVFAAALRPTLARADRPVCADAPSDAAVRERLRILSRHVTEHEPAVRRWVTFFAFLHTSMGSGAAILAGSATNEGFRNEMLVGMTSSLLGLVSLVIVTPPLFGAGDRLRDLPEDTPGQRLYKLRIAESMFDRSASSIDFLLSAFPVLLTNIYVTAASITLRTALDRVTGSYTHAAGGAVLGLGRIFLRPIGPRASWRRYRRAYADAGCEERASTGLPGPSVRLFSTGLGLGLQVRF